MANTIIPSVAVPAQWGQIVLNPDGTSLGGAGGAGAGGMGASEQHIGQVGGHLATPSASFTRPSDTIAYASGDLVANSTAAGSVSGMLFNPVARVAAGSVRIRAARLRKTGAVVTNAQFRLHLYTGTPTVTNGDNGVWLTNEVASYLGSLDITLDRVFSDGAFGRGLPTVGSELSIAFPGGAGLIGLLEARAAYTPANAEVFTATLEVLQN